MMELSRLFFIIINLTTFISWIVLLIIIFDKRYQKYQTKVLIIIALWNIFAFSFPIVSKLFRTSPPIENNIQKGELWDIETIFKQEKKLSLRTWKQNLLKELTFNLSQYRKGKELPSLNIKTIESFSPQKLHKALLENPENFILLDVREPLEISKFRLKNSLYHRYGDLANDIFPSIPMDKKIIIICYSGIRGFIAGNLLSTKGYKNIAFIRGGLGSWVKKNLPIEGEDTFEFLQDKYKEIPINKVKEIPLPKIQFLAGTPEPYSDNFIPSPGDLVSSIELKKFIKRFLNQRLILVCKTESDCFDAVAFSYVFELEGGEILGYSKIK